SLLILTPPDPSLPFVLDTDASDVGMGAVLSQVGLKGEKVVAYYFNKAERCYCVTCRELLAIVRAIGHFKYYLCGLPFNVRTDHSAYCPSKNQKGRLHAGWKNCLRMSSRWTDSLIAGIIPRQDHKYPSPDRPDSRYPPAHEYGYYGHTDEYRHWDNRYPGDLCRYPPDRLQPDDRPQTPPPHGRPPPAETYHGLQLTIPDLVHEDPREFARLKLALDNILPLDAPELFKFQILTDHLKCEEALLIADSYSHSPFSFSDTMRALTELYGQPQHLALKRITKLMDGRGDWKPVPRKERRSEYKSHKTTTILHDSEHKGKSEKNTTATQEKPKKYCPFCDTVQHDLNQCSNFKLLSREQKTEWIKVNKRCWRCGSEHQAAKCNLKAKCKQCERRHLEVLHEVNTSQNAPASGKPSTTKESTCLVSSISKTLYVDRPTSSSQVLLKLSRVIHKSGTKVIETYAILVRSVPYSYPGKSFQIHRVFTAEKLGLARHTYPVNALQERYHHLKDLPLPDIREAQPLLLIGSDNPHLITPVEPARLGPPGGPAAVRTRLGWTLQGPSRFLHHQITPQQCLFTSCASPEAELFSHVERLWQMDILPYWSERLISRSRQDAKAIRRLEEKTIRVTVDGVRCYAIPSLWKENRPPLHATQGAVLAQLCGTERRLVREPERAAAYSKEIHKLPQLDAGYVTPVLPAEAAKSNRSWFIPHHMVQHNGKDRIVFNCSFTFQGQSLNDHLLPGPTLSANLLGVLLRFREHPVAISSDVKGMFHQVRLLEEDKPFLCFLWRDMKVDEKPTIYKWQVLPFGTTCNPCCAIFALQSHVQKHIEPEEDAHLSMERNFYVDNCLQSLPSEVQAKKLVDCLQSLLMEGGFELRQWARNIPAVIGHLLVESRSESSVLCFSQESADPQECTLRLVWQCKSDTLRYKHHQSGSPEQTMRNIYRLLAQQYDPLGFIIPYTTRAKVIVQHLRNKKMGRSPLTRRSAPSLAIMGK
ncbi:hypothetical protein L3Q82_022037, partial [Scortum barcoo]